MNIWKKMAAKPFNPILWRSQKSLVVMFFVPARAFVFMGFLSQMRSFAPLVVKYRRIKPAVKISVGLRKKMIGEHAAAVPHQRCKHPFRGVRLRSQAAELRVQDRS